MAVRNTNLDLRGITRHLRNILPDEVDTDDADFTYYIEIASALTNKVEACAIALGTPLDAESLTMIERLLAAHFWGIDDQLFASKKTERAAASFGGKTEMGLDFTPFGQMARGFDETGCLDKLFRPKVRVGVEWLGKSRSNQTDYVDRD